jgi:hypothetical protein
MERVNSVVGRGFTHAWAKIYFPEYGWNGLIHPSASASDPGISLEG